MKDQKKERFENDIAFLEELNQKYGDIFNAIEANKNALAWPSDEDTALVFKQIKDNTAAVGSIIEGRKTALTQIINPPVMPMMVEANQMVVSKTDFEAMAARLAELEAAQAKSSKKATADN